MPVQLSISDGRMFLREGKPIMEEVINQAKEVDAPVHTMIRVDRHIGRAIPVQDDPRSAQGDLVANSRRIAPVREHLVFDRGSDTWNRRTARHQDPA